VRTHRYATGYPATRRSLPLSNFLLAAMPALLARRHVEPLLDAADEMRRRAA
jgi:hypothetical protein